MITFILKCDKCGKECQKKHDSSWVNYHGTGYRKVTLSVAQTTKKVEKDFHICGDCLIAFGISSDTPPYSEDLNVVQKLFDLISEIACPTPQEKEEEDG